MARDFGWGLADCALAALAVSGALRGHQAATRMAARYRDRKTAAALVALHGSLAGTLKALAGEMGFAEAGPPWQEGDIAVAGSSVRVYVGKGGWAVKTVTGFQMQEIEIAAAYRHMP